MRRICCAVLATALLLHAPGAMAAQAEAKPDTKAEEAAEDDDPSKFFLFHKAGVNEAEAKADIEYCGSFAWKVDARPKQAVYSAGLIGVLVSSVANGISAGVERRRMRDAAMRKCMGYLDYDRYFVAEPQWNEITRADDAAARMAAFAAGPLPSGERLPQ